MAHPLHLPPVDWSSPMTRGSFRYLLIRHNQEREKDRHLPVIVDPSIQSLFRKDQVGESRHPSHTMRKIVYNIFVQIIRDSMSLQRLAVRVRERVCSYWCRAPHATQLRGPCLDHDEGDPEIRHRRQHQRRQHQRPHSLLRPCRPILCINPPLVTKLSTHMQISGGQLASKR